MACLHTLVDLNLFEKWVDDGSGAKSSADLAKMVGADEVLVRTSHLRLSTFGPNELARNSSDNHIQNDCSATAPPQVH